MKLQDIKAGDTLCSTDKHGTGYYRVRKVCRVKLRVLGENGNEFLSYPHMFDRKVDYPIKNLDRWES